MKMLETARRMILAHPETVLREALGLAALSVAILAMLYLPVLA
jgi:hypothetical protein